MPLNIDRKSVIFVVMGSTGELAGTERVLLDWCRYIDPAKINIVICSQKGNFWKIVEKEIPSVIFKELIFDFKKSNIRRFFDTMFFFKKLNSERIIWLSNGIKGVTLWEMIASWFATGGNIYVSHHVCPQTDRRLSLKKRIDIYLQEKLTKKILAVSSDVKFCLMDRWNIPGRKISVVKTGVNIAVFKPDQRAREELRNELKIPHSAKVFIAVNRFTKQKRIDRLLGAFLLLLKGGRQDIFLFIAGDGEFKNKYSEKIKRNDLLCRQVKILGFREDLPKFFQFADFMILASDNEGQSNVIKEAMACNVIPVVTDTPGSREISKEIFISERNVYSFYRKINLVLALPQDEINRRKEANFRTAIEDFGLTKCCADALSNFGLPVKTR